MSISEVTNILKHDYKNMTDLLNNSVGLCAQLDKRTDSIVGDYAVIAMEVGREFGIGARLELDTYPIARSVAPQQAHVTVKRTYGVYRMTKAEMSAMSNDKGAFVRAQPRRMKNLYSACQRDYARQTWGDGSGAIATCAASGPSTTVALAATTPEAALVNLAEGMQIDIGTVAAPTVAAADRTVMSVNFAAATIVVSGAAVTVTGSHFIFRQGSGGTPQSATQRELTGVGRGVDDDTTLQDLDPALVWNWKATVNHNSGVLRPPSENLLERVVHQHENRSGATVDELRAGDGVFRAMVNNLKGRQRVVNDLALHGGHKAIDYTFGAESMPLSRDRDATPSGPNSLWGFEWSSMAVYVQDDWQWEDEDGTVLRMAGDRTHAFEALYYTFRELGWEQRNHNFRIDDLETA